LSYRITKNCISCGVCILKCANRAVYVNNEDQYAIDPGRCTECVELPRRRCHLICTAGAIQPDPAYQENREQLWKKHRRLHPAPSFGD